MKEIVLGTIGSGFIVHNILDAVERTDGIRLGAVYSRSEKKGRELAESYGVSRVYTALEDLWNDPQINTIYIASPNVLHYEHCLAALNHGKHVICEKPFCPTGEEVRKLLQTAQSRGLFLIDATPMAFLPNYRILKDKLHQIGRIRIVTCNYSQYSSRYDLLQQYLNPSGSVPEAELPNVFNPDFAGGCLMDINYYNVYFMVSLFGKPQNAVYYPNWCEAGVDTSGIIVLQYSDFVGQGTGAKDTFGVNSAQIEGEKGYLYVENGSNGFSEVRLVTKTDRETYDEQTQEIPGESNRWYYEIQNMTRMMLDGDRERGYRQVLIAAEVMDVIKQALRDK